MDVAVHKRRKVVDGVVDAVVRDSSLRIVVGADFSGAVACRHHCFASRRDVVNVFLMFFVVDECAQTGEGAFLVFGLVARFRTFDEDFLHNTGVGVR